MAGKWLELLTEIAPGVKRAAIMFNPDTAPGGGSYYLPSFEAAARSLKVEPIRRPSIATPKSKRSSPRLGASREAASSSCRMLFVLVHRAPIISLAARNNVPAVYRNLSLSETAVCFPTDQTSQTYFVAPRPMSIAFSVAQSRRTCPFNCRSNLRWLLNVKTAKALGLTVPQSILLRAEAD